MPTSAPSDRPRILLLQPQFGDWERLEGFMPPLGLLHAARNLGDEFAVQILDQRLLGARWPDALRRALQPPPLLVGLTAVIGESIGASLAMAAEVRRHCPQVPLVWGGVAVSALPQVALGDPLVDVVVHGAGEWTLPELARALRDGRPLQPVAGLYLRDPAAPGGVVYTGARPWTVRNDLLPIQYSLVDMQHYVGHYRGGGWLPMVSSFGCPGECTFCYAPGLFGGRWAADPAEQVLAEVREAQQKFPVHTIQFVDDNFFADRRRALAVARGLEPLGLRWVAHGLTISTALRMSDADFDLLARSGCIELGSGLESGSDRMLANLIKGHCRAEAVLVNRRLARLPLAVNYGMMSGFPGETAADLDQTIDLAEQLLTDNPRAQVRHILPLFPLPGSPVWQQALDHGFVPPATWRDWSNYEARSARLPWLTARQRARLDGLFLCSVFARSGVLQRHGLRGPLPWLADHFYTPVARWRLAHRAFDGMVEVPLVRAAEAVVRYVRHNIR
ncbi:MAG: radical SAM protein [Deltaproteobacteria bacterium]|nr:radical SAM protein [Deltaproteobacteria bacterium]